MDKINILDMTKQELESFMRKLGEKPFRGRQIFRWIHQGMVSFDEMTNLPKTLRDKLGRACEIRGLHVIREQESKDGTIKFLHALSDGNAIETVFMKYKYGNSICVSTQAGCRMGCTFCASGKLGLARNLSAGEMAGQILSVKNETGKEINHIILMGIGEPFDNYDEVAKFIDIANDSDGYGIGMRNITVSTSGLIPMIHRFAEDFPQAGLAVSLHGATDDIRSSMMPVNRRYPIKDLMDACRDYTEKTSRRITFEYAVVEGVNDSDEDVERLAVLLGGMLCHVNLIPLNETYGSAKSSGHGQRSRKRAGEMARLLEERGIRATVRRSLGADIDAACGQLRLAESALRNQKSEPISQ